MNIDSCEILKENNDATITETQSMTRNTREQTTREEDGLNKHILVNNNYKY